MFEDFAIAAALIGVAFVIYKWFEALIFKKERLELISRLDGEGLVEYLKRMPMGLGGGSKPVNSVVQQEADYKQPHPATWALRWGLLAIGLGAGLFFALFLTEMNHYELSDYNGRKMVDFTILIGGLLGAGLGMLISFIIEYFLCKKSKE
jgi:hypothetical protein